jgi:hypothetical protein
MLSTGHSIFSILKLIHRILVRVQEVECFFDKLPVNESCERVIPSKPLTLDLMETLDFFFRRACYHRNASYRKKRKRKEVVEKLWIYIFGSLHF